MQKEYKINKKRIGNELRILRKEKKMSQVVASELIGISSMTLKGIELGRTSVSVPMFVNICTVYQQEPTEVLNKVIQISSI